VSVIETVKPIGDIEMIIEYNDGRPKEVRTMKNTVLKAGRIALAKSLANDVGNTYDFYVARMLFGNGGTAGGVPKYVDEGRNGLFGLTVLSKPILSSIDPNQTTQVIFTSVIAFNEVNNVAINEMALQMNNGQLYSMRTFPDLTKTDHIQVTWNWKLNFV
jgi:hypothetical protein